MRVKTDIIDTVIETGNFKTIIEALERAELNETLKDKGQLTIFAPTDEAFSSWPKGKFEGLLNPEKNRELQSQMMYHIVLDKLMVSDLKNLDQIKNVRGNVLRIESREGLWLNEARIVLPDLESSNGVIHGIDSVLMPETVSATAG